MSGPLGRLRPTTQGWRMVEVAAVDAARRQGCRLRYEHGVTYVITEFFDGDSGELLATRRVLDVEAFARDVAAALVTVGATL
jgi:hypothetical protein